jgi:hypothetical protein
MPKSSSAFRFKAVNLERWKRLVVTFGQDQQRLEQIEQGELHSVMAAYGLWKDEDDLATLADEITSNLKLNLPALHLNYKVSKSR